MPCSSSWQVIHDAADDLHHHVLNNYYVNYVNLIADGHFNWIWELPSSWFEELVWNWELLFDKRREIGKLEKQIWKLKTWAANQQLIITRQKTIHSPFETATELWFEVQYIEAFDMIKLSCGQKAELNKFTQRNGTLALSKQRFNVKPKNIADNSAMCTVKRLHYGCAIWILKWNSFRAKLFQKRHAIVEFKLLMTR